MPNRSFQRLADVLRARPRRPKCRCAGAASPGARAGSGRAASRRNSVGTPQKIVGSCFSSMREDGRRRRAIRIEDRSSRRPPSGRTARCRAHRRRTASPRNRRRRPRGCRARPWRIGAAVSIRLECTCLRALRRAGRAGGIKPEGGLVRMGVDGRELVGGFRHQRREIEFLALRARPADHDDMLQVGRAGERRSQ